MTVTDVVKSTEDLTLTITADFAAPPSRVWQVWADPRQLERWWGPPTWPATFEEHDFWAGGRVKYYMTGPNGDKARGWWQFTSIDEPHSLQFEDGFADPSGEPDASMPTVHVGVELRETSNGTRMTVISHFNTPEQMAQLAAMGMVEGMREAMGQIDTLLAT